MAFSTLTSKGQLTVPKIVRERLGLQPGDRVDFRLEHDGSARMLPVSRKVSDVFGMLTSCKKGKPLSVDDMNQRVKAVFRRKKS